MVFFFFRLRSLRFPGLFKKNATAVLLDVEMPNKETLMPACVVSLVGCHVCAIDIICILLEKGIAHLPLVCHALIDIAGLQGERETFIDTTDLGAASPANITTSTPSL